MNDDVGCGAVTDLIARADAAFSAGNAEQYGSLFTEEAQLYLLHREALIGRTAIVGAWGAFFARMDTSAWDPRTEIVEVHDDRAYAFATYTERLLDRETGSRTLVRGRLTYWLRRGLDGEWRIGLLMNSHSHPMEPIE